LGVYWSQDFLCGEFSPHGNKKRGRGGLANPTEGLVRFFKKNLPYHDAKILKVAKFK
jgi:hypothetical protein